MLTVARRVGPCILLSVRLKQKGDSHTKTNSHPVACIYTTRTVHRDALFETDIHSNAVITAPPNCARDVIYKPFSLAKKAQKRRLIAQSNA